MSKRAQGWYDMERRYTHNKVPEIPVVTAWEKVIAACGLTEEQALVIVASPETREARKIKRRMTEDYAYRNKFFPEVVLAAFGLDEEVEARIAGEWSNSRGPRKAKYAKEKRAVQP